MTPATQLILATYLPGTLICAGAGFMLACAGVALIINAWKGRWFSTN